MVVLIRKNKQEQGVIHKVLSKIRYSVCLDNGKFVDRYINHIWKGGTVPPIIPEGSDDDWTLSDHHVAHTLQHKSLHQHRKLVPDH